MPETAELVRVSHYQTHILTYCIIIIIGHVSVVFRASDLSPGRCIVE